MKQLYIVYYKGECIKYAYITTSINNLDDSESYYTLNCFNIDLFMESIALFYQETENELSIDGFNDYLEFKK